MKNPRNTTETEKIIVVISFVIFLTSSIVFFDTQDSLQTICAIMSILSLSEMIFIFMYRDIVETTKNLDHDILSIGFVKGIAIATAIITILIIGAVIVVIILFLNLLYMCLIAILPLIIPALYIITILVPVVTANKLIVDKVYKKSKK